MRILCAIELEPDTEGRTADPDAVVEYVDPDAVAEYVNAEFLPTPQQTIFVSGEEGESSFIVKSTRAWHDEETTTNGAGRRSHAMQDQQI